MKQNQKNLEWSEFTSDSFGPVLHTAAGSGLTGPEHQSDQILRLINKFNRWEGFMLLPLREAADLCGTGPEPRLKVLILNQSELFLNIFSFYIFFLSYMKHRNSRVILSQPATRHLN